MLNKFYNTKILLSVDEIKKSLSKVVELNSQYKREKALNSFYKVDQNRKPSKYVIYAYVFQ